MINTFMTMWINSSKRFNKINQLCCDQSLSYRVVLCPVWFKLPSNSHRSPLIETQRNLCLTFDHATRWLSTNMCGYLKTTEMIRGFWQMNPSCSKTVTLVADVFLRRRQSLKLDTQIRKVSAARTRVVNPY